MSKKNKKFKHSSNHKPRPQQAAPEVIEKLDLGYLNAATVVLPDWKMVQIVQAGGGGTGSYMAQHVGRIMRVLYQMDKGAHWLICDPDEVKDINVGRQLFCDAEVGMPKAEALMRRYGTAWGLNCSARVGVFDESLLLGDVLTVVVGCVDKAEGRRTMHDALMLNPVDIAEGRPRVWWLDCGNLKDTGRVLLGSAYSAGQVRGAFIDEKHCVALPSPALQSPGLLEDAPEDLPDGRMSCAEMAAANLQSLNINACIAAQAADMLTRLLITKDLKRFACEVNVAAGSARSYYNTPDEVSRVIRQLASFVVAHAAGAQSRATMAATGA